MRTPLIALAVLFVASATAQAAATTFDMEIRMVSPEQADVTIDQTWDGQDARPFRQSLDVLFGDANGDLSPTEVEVIARATEDDMRAKTLPMLTLDGTASNVTAVTVSFTDAAAPTNALQPMSMRHELAVALTADANATASTLVVTPMGNGTLTFEAPAGWEVVGVEGGAAWTETATGRVGEVVVGEPVTFTLREAAANATVEPEANATADANATSETDAGVATETDATVEPEPATETEVVYVPDRTDVQPEARVDEATGDERQLPAFGVLAAVGAAAVALLRRRP